MLFIYLFYFKVTFFCEQNNLTTGSIVAFLDNRIFFSQHQLPPDHEIKDNCFLLVSVFIILWYMVQIFIFSQFIEVWQEGTLPHYSCITVKFSKHLFLVSSWRNNLAGRFDQQLLWLYLYVPDKMSNLVMLLCILKNCNGCSPGCMWVYGAYSLSVSIAYPHF